MRQNRRGSPHRQRLEAMFKELARSQTALSHVEHELSKGDPSDRYLQLLHDELAHRQVAATQRVIAAAGSRRR